LRLGEPNEQPGRLRGRYFNRLTLDLNRATVTKTSSNDQKLRDEIQWYLDLPTEMADIIPGIEGYSLVPSRPASIDMEYMGSTTIGDDYADNGLPERVWTTVLDKLQDLLREFASYAGSVTHEQLHAMYVDKTELRIAEVLAQHSVIRSIHNRGFYRLNGVTMLCPIALFNNNRSEIFALLRNAQPALIHGDFCFSNLFYSPNHPRGIKVIDPRGSFGVKGIYGDQRYDMAKVRHSLSGYEHVLRNRFKIFSSDRSVDLEIDAQRLRRQVRNRWDGHLGDQLRAVKLIEALLFLSMLPLHRDSELRQLAFYALATELLLEAISE